MLKTKTVVGIGVVVCAVVGGDEVVGTSVVSQGIKDLSIVPLTEHMAVIQLPRPSVV